MSSQDRAIHHDRRVAVSVVAAVVIFLGWAILYLQPWGAEPAASQGFDAYWSGVATASDFISFWTGASLVREGDGATLYDMERQHRFQVALRSDRFQREKLVDRLDPFHNPPPMALIFLPLTLFPLSWAFVIWSGINVLAFAVAFALPLRGSRAGWTPVALMLATGAVADSLLWGQADSVFALALSAALLAMISGRSLGGGMLLGVLWLKPQYALVFPVIFVYKRRWRELAGMVATGAVIFAISLLMIGTDGLALYIQVLRDAGSFAPPAASFIFPELMVNWRALLVNLWPDIPASTGGVLVGALGAATLLSSLLAWRGAYDASNRIYPLQLIVATGAAVLASPHSHIHGLTLLFPVIALGLARGGDRLLPRGSWGVLCTVGMALTWTGWLAVTLRWLIAPYLFVVLAFLVIWIARTRTATRPLRLGHL